VNSWADSIFSPKSKKSRKVGIEHFIPLILSHLVKFFCVYVLLKAYSNIELSNHFIVPIFLKSQDISQVFCLASCNDSVKDWIMLVLHVGPINPLRIYHWFVLGHDYGLIEILLKKGVKSIVIGISRLSASMDPPIFPLRSSLTLIANFYPPYRVCRCPEYKRSHVSIVRMVDLFHIKHLFFLFTIITISPFLSLFLNFIISPCPAATCTSQPFVMRTSSG
jgi:hypothetical protein